MQPRVPNDRRGEHGRQWPPRHRPRWSRCCCGAAPAPEAPAAADAVALDATLDSLELLANGEDVDLVENDLAFYDWVEATEFDPGASAG